MLLCFVPLQKHGCLASKTYWYFNEHSILFLLHSLKKLTKKPGWNAQRQSRYQIISVHKSIQSFAKPFIDKL